jgi:hypothetical protein
MTDAEASEPMATESAPASFKDRYAGLCIFGVFEIIGGVVAALLIPAGLFHMLSPSVPRAAESEWTRRGLAVMCTWFAFTAVGLVSLGIGAMRAARWAWALNLILSWFAVAGSLILGVPTLAHVLVTAESTGAEIASAFAFAFVVGVPLLFLLFYRDKDVELTCAHRDPIERWTDRRPLPVLAAVMFCLWGACATLSSLAFPSWASDGLAGKALPLALAAADIYAAVAMFKARSSGWWVALGVQIAHSIQTVLRLVAPADVDSFSPAGPPQPGKAWGTSSGWVMAILFTIANVAFLLWVRRYFRRRSSEPDPGRRSSADDQAP